MNREELKLRTVIRDFTILIFESARVLQMVGVTTGFSAVTTGFLLWTLTGENGRERGLTGWTTALDWELARSDSLAAGKELVTGSKVPSDLLQLKSGHSENLDFTRLFFVPSCTTLDVTTYNVVMKIVVRRASVNLIHRGVNRYPRRCKSFLQWKEYFTYTNAWIHDCIM